MHTFLHTTVHKPSHIIYHWIDLVGLKYIILVIKTADDSTARHASWISCAALWIPGSAGQGQPANLPCDVMPLSDADDTHTQLLGCGEQCRERERWWGGG